MKGLSSSMHFVLVEHLVLGFHHGDARDHRLLRRCSSKEWNRGFVTKQWSRVAPPVVRNPTENGTSLQRQHSVMQIFLKTRSRRLRGQSRWRLAPRYSDAQLKILSAFVLGILKALPVLRRCIKVHSARLKPYCGSGRGRAPCATCSWRCRSSATVFRGLWTSINRRRNEVGA